MIKKILILFISWRIIIFLIAFIATYVIKDFGNKFPYVEILQKNNLPYWIWSFGNFDGVHYLRIAQDGYAYQYTQVFSPLYPILIKIISFLFFNNYLLSAILVSNVAFLIGLIFFFKLVSKEYSEKVALWASVFLLAFPTSFYFGSAYTEGLFFMMIILCFYYMDKGKVFTTAILGAFSSSTRLIGVLLLPSLFNFKKLKQSKKFRWRITACDTLRLYNLISKK